MVFVCFCSSGLWWWLSGFWGKTPHIPRFFKGLKVQSLLSPGHQPGSILTSFQQLQSLWQLIYLSYTTMRLWSSSLAGFSLRQPLADSEVPQLRLSDVQLVNYSQQPFLLVVSNIVFILKLENVMNIYNQIDFHVCSAAEINETSKNSKGVSKRHEATWLILTMKFNRLFQGIQSVPVYLADFCIARWSQ